TISTSPNRCQLPSRSARGPRRSGTPRREGSERTRLARGLPRWHSPDRESGCAQVSWTGSKRDCLIFLALPFVLSVAQGAKSKHERLFQHLARGTASLSLASCHVARSIGQ